jgi:hypothetical protein
MSANSAPSTPPAREQTTMPAPATAPDPASIPASEPARPSVSAAPRVSGSTGVVLSPPALVVAPAPAGPPTSAPQVAAPAPAADTSLDPVPWSRVEVITPSRYRSLAKSDSALLARSARGCACRIEGTIEVRSEQPLTRRRSLVVLLNGEVALRDTVDLFMGSPRSFAFRDLPCGRYSLDVQVPGTTRFRLVTPRSMRTVSCTQGELRQIRLVLEPR